jgi:hypothetical protein
VTRIIRLITIILFLAFPCAIKSQGLTEKDFNLLIDGKTFPDSTTTIDALLKMNIVKANFSWVSFTELAIYIDFRTDEERKHVYDGTTVTLCNGNFICDDVRKLFKKLRPGNTVTFQANNATNKSGNKLIVQDLTLRVK